MKVLVGYMSQTGNTQKVAEAIFGEIEGNKEMKTLDQIRSLEGYDLAFIGFPIQAFAPANDAKVFLEQHSAGANIAMFVTHGTPEDHEELPGWLQKCKDAAAGAKVAGFFDCQGELAEWVADMLKQSGDPKMAGYAEARPASIGQPDETRLERARAFARGVMGKQ